jgi:hypothetical protein
MGQRRTRPERGRHSETYGDVTNPSREGGVAPGPAPPPPGSVVEPEPEP